MERCTIGCPPDMLCLGCSWNIPRHSEETERQRSYTVNAGVRNGKAIPPYKEKKYIQLSLEL